MKPNDELRSILREEDAFKLNAGASQCLNHRGASFERFQMRRRHQLKGFAEPSTDFLGNASDNLTVVCMKRPPKQAMSYFRFSLRSLCNLGVSAVNKRFEYIHRRDAENAEGAQRISN